MRFLRFAAIMVVCPLLFAANLPRNNEVEGLMDSGHWKKARAIVEPLYRANPNDPYAMHLMSRIKWNFWDHQGGLQLAEEAVQRDPSKINYHLELAHMYGQMLQEATGWGRLPVGLKFRRQIDAALAIDSKNLYAILMRAVYEAVAPRIAGGDRAHAETLVAQLPALDPVKGNVAAGRYSYNIKDWGRSERYYKAALAANPRSYEAEIAMANLFSFIMDSPKWDLAEYHARQAIAIDPTRGEAYGVRAAALAYMEKWQELDALIASEAHNDPDDFSALYFAAKELRVTGKDLARAEQYLRTYMQKEPEGDTPSVVQAKSELGLVLAKLGRRSEPVHGD